MDDWFGRVGKPALFSALTTTCDILSENFNKEVQLTIQENARLRDELEPLRTKAARVEQLEDEHLALREEILELKVKAQKSRAASEKPSEDTSSANGENATPSIKHTARTPLAPRSTNTTTSFRTPAKYERSDVDKLDLRELREEHTRLKDNYNKLHEKYLETLNARTELDHRLREKIKNVEQWMNHANELNAQSQKRLQKVKKLEAQLASMGETRSKFTASFSSEAPISAPTDASRDLQSAPPTITSNRESDRESDRGSDTTNWVPSGLHSFSTEKSREKTPPLPPLPQNQDEMQVVIKTEPSSDTPVVVSERSVRKRRREIDEADNTPDVTRVKTEDKSDTGVYEARRIPPQDSMDFDAEIPHVQTPRKHRLRLFQENDNSHTSNPPYPQHDSSRPSSISAEGETPTMRPASTTHQRTSAVGDATTSGAGGAQIASSHTRLALALKPPSKNALKNQASRGSKAINSKPTSLQHGLASLAEDDDQNQFSKISKAKSRAPRSNVLSGLLNSPSTEQGTTVRSAASQSEPPSTSMPPPAASGFRFEIPPGRELPFGKDKHRRVSENLQRAKSPDLSTPTAVGKGGPASHKRSGGRPISPPPATTSTRKDSNAKDNKSVGATPSFKGTVRAPLREQPLSQLRLDDFKVNPATNEGYSYAFRDVVRGGAERSTALVGCTREDCCGKEFRALARAERHTTGTFAFRALLEEHLGDDAWRLGSMSTQEKEDLWVEAKTRALANEYGRCRHRYQRMRSPPGFWRTDFPSTQEENEHRAQGQKMEAEMIKERHREAMRPGGRWLFRDE